MIPSVKSLPSVHIYVNKETTFTDLKVNVISIIIIIIIIIIISNNNNNTKANIVLIMSLSVLDF